MKHLQYTALLFFLCSFFLAGCFSPYTGGEEETGITLVIGGNSRGTSITQWPPTGTEQSRIRYEITLINAGTGKVTFAEARGSGTVRIRLVPEIYTLSIMAYHADDTEPCGIYYQGDIDVGRGKTNAVQVLMSPSSELRFTVTFAPDGGTPNPTQQIVTQGSQIGTLPTVTKAAPEGLYSGNVTGNLTFDGWWDNTTNTQYTSTSTVTRNITLTARWIPAIDVSGQAGADIITKAINYINSNSGTYTMLLASKNIGPAPALTGTGRSLTLRGIGATSISLLSNGTLFTVGAGATLILDNNITLYGRTTNNASLVRVDGGTLTMNAGSVIRDNIISPVVDSLHGGGV